jgi:hypothetical protein
MLSQYLEHFTADDQLLRCVRPQVADLSRSLFTDELPESSETGQRFIEPLWY